MSDSTATIEALGGFDDPRCEPAVWNALLARGGTDAPFLTWEWQKAWWASFDRSGLLLIGASRDGDLLAVAPFFAEEGMIYFVGSGGSDYLDFIGDISAPEVLDGLLAHAKSRVPDFAGFRFYHVPDASPAAGLLRASALRLDLVMREDGVQSAPATRLGVDEKADSALTQYASPAGWLRFTRIEADGRPIAFHFGLAYHGGFMWYKPAFAIDLARHSPGEVLLRQLLLRAIDERAHTFDFGLGDEPFKQRFATHTQTVRNFVLYSADGPAPELW